MAERLQSRVFSSSLPAPVAPVIALAPIAIAAVFRDATECVRPLLSAQDCLLQGMGLRHTSCTAGTLRIAQLSLTNSVPGCNFNSRVAFSSTARFYFNERIFLIINGPSVQSSLPKFSESFRTAGEHPHPGAHARLTASHHSAPQPPDIRLDGPHRPPARADGGGCEQGSRPLLRHEGLHLRTEPLAASVHA